MFGQYTGNTLSNYLFKQFYNRMITTRSFYVYKVSVLIRAVWSVKELRILTFLYFQGNRLFFQVFLHRIYTDWNFFLLNQLFVAIYVLDAITLYESE